MSNKYNISNGEKLKISTRLWAQLAAHYILIVSYQSMKFAGGGGFL